MTPRCSQILFGRRLLNWWLNQGQLGTFPGGRHHFRFVARKKGAQSLGRCGALVLGRVLGGLDGDLPRAEQKNGQKNVHREHGCSSSRESAVEDSGGV